jgi:hypothetical protein
MLHCEIVVLGEQVNVVSSDHDMAVDKEALPTASTEFEPALIDSVPGFKRTES